MQGKRELTQELQVGDKVIAKHKNGRYYTCEIASVQEELFCKAAFEDGSLSTNLYPEDIQVLCPFYWTQKLIYKNQDARNNIIKDKISILTDLTVLTAEL